ncbi:MAG: FapA family protein, partial [Proteobacteria bacterium]|nr:FapA family protein [Pseudomonadota bacterium]
MAEPRDAQFRFAMSEDGMKLGVSRYSPPQGGEGPSVALLKRQVAKAGVGLPVDEEAAREIISAIQRDEEIRRVVLVRGIEVQEPSHASLVALGNLEYPVFPGDRFARKHPPQHAR